MKTEMDRMRHYRDQLAAMLKEDTCDHYIEPTATRDVGVKYLAQSCRMHLEMTPQRKAAIYNEIDRVMAWMEDQYSSKKMKKNARKILA